MSSRTVTLNLSEMERFLEVLQTHYDGDGQRFMDEVRKWVRLMHDDKGGYPTRVIIPARPSMRDVEDQLIAGLHTTITEVLDDEITEKLANGI